MSRVNKKTKQVLFDKYNGKCGYTGKDLEHDWQVDHITPISHFKYFTADPDCNNINNLIPTNKIINHYKRAKDLESFRYYMKNFHIRLKRVPKNPKVLSSIKRKQYMEKIAEYFNITTDIGFDGIFYFEKLENV